MKNRKLRINSFNGTSSIKNRTKLNAYLKQQRYSRAPSIRGNREIVEDDGYIRVSPVKTNKDFKSDFLPREGKSERRRRLLFDNLNGRLRLDSRNKKENIVQKNELNRIIGI